MGPPSASSTTVCVDRPRAARNGRPGHLLADAQTRKAPCSHDPVAHWNLEQTGVPASGMHQICPPECLSRISQREAAALEAQLREHHWPAITKSRFDTRREPCKGPRLADSMLRMTLSTPPTRLWGMPQLATMRGHLSGPAPHSSCSVPVTWLGSAASLLHSAVLGLSLSGPEGAQSRAFRPAHCGDFGWENRHGPHYYLRDRP